MINNNQIKGLKWPHLVPGILIKRYKRFMADVMLRNGETVTAHCPNSGSMKSCNVSGMPVYLSFNPKPERKLKYTWEIIKIPESYVGINTQIPNRLIKASIETRQIVAFVNEDHSLETCQKLWDQIPEEYRRCHTFSDFWKAYEAVFPEETHRSVVKETGKTAHMERWNNTLRQRVGRFVRETLSFSKDELWHDKVTLWFILTYNKAITSC
ncbi:MAG: hypothetical protein HQK77_16370 [Desulfobacterales bacterium]|nr:hypothetical protein [Desulfobacterales bacterium]